jgi:hypothetical protein
MNARGLLGVMMASSIAAAACSASGERGGAQLGAGGDGGSGGGDEAASGGSTTTAPACAYPMGTVGTTLGSLVNSNLTWQGFPEGADQATTIRITDYLDCDGSRGINALLVDTSATWCEACQVEAKTFDAKIANGWQQKGIHVLTLMVENAASQPATLQTAQQWKQTYQLTTAVAADPGYSFVGSSSSIGLPLEVVVDPRTMKIVDREEGYSGDYSKLEGVALQNQQH